MAKNDEVAPPADPNTGEVTEEGAMAMISKEFFTDAGIALPDNDPLEIQKAIVQRVMAASTLDDLFGVWEAKTSDKFENTIIDVMGVEWGVYHADYGDIPLARVNMAAHPEKKPDVMITTSPNLTSFIARAAAIGALPFTAKIVGSKTRNGQTALHFERA